MFFTARRAMMAFRTTLDGQEYSLADFCYPRPRRRPSGAAASPEFGGLQPVLSDDDDDEKEEEQDTANERCLIFSVGDHWADNTSLFDADINFLRTIATTRIASARGQRTAFFGHLVDVDAF